MLGKRNQNMKTHQKSDSKMEPKSIKNHSKNRCEKRDEKKGAIPEKTLGRQNARNPQRLSFQKTPSEENREESQLKLANKVECKKWSAKGTYRKASADREPTTHLNTLGGQRPRADSLIQVPTAKFRTWSQRMIFEWGFYHRFAWYELQDIQLIPGYMLALWLGECLGRGFVHHTQRTSSGDRRWVLGGWVWLGGLVGWMSVALFRTRVADYIG